MFPCGPADREGAVRCVHGYASHSASYRGLRTSLAGPTPHQSPPSRPSTGGRTGPQKQKQKQKQASSSQQPAASSEQPNRIPQISPKPFLFPDFPPLLGLATTGLLLFPVTKTPPTPDPDCHRQLGGECLQGIDGIAILSRCRSKDWVVGRLQSCPSWAMSPDGKRTCP